MIEVFLLPSVWFPCIMEQGLSLREAEVSRSLSTADIRLLELFWYQAEG